jgi:hypothetical protein
MTLRVVTRAVIARVEEVSGCPVVVSEDAALKTLAASRIARGENRIHSISFNPSVVREPDYLIQGMRVRSCFIALFLLLALVYRLTVWEKYESGLQGYSS